MLCFLTKHIYKGIIHKALAHIFKYSSTSTASPRVHDFQIVLIRLLLKRFFFITETQAQSVSEPDETSNVIEEAVDLERQINLEVKNDDTQELLDSRNQELTVDELTKLYEQEQDIKEMESLDPVRTDKWMTVGNLTEGHVLIKKSYKF
ncbi:tigger transposable element-derived protein 1 [Trichonephila clavipes]|nr:tigger transposable element-derived protein 1 [Trichonephila clavipes]